MTTVAEINYVAGILEGEGTFQINNSSPGIALNMTDEDVVEKVRNIVNHDGRMNTYNIPGRKDMYRINISGSLAIQWMMTLYPLMGRRRRAKIREIVEVWKSSENRARGSSICRNGHSLSVYGKDYILANNGHRACRHCQKNYDRMR